jgi:hypothetical protein
MQSNSSQSINQNIHTNTGNIQGLAAGRDANASQGDSQENKEITQWEAVELLQHIEKLIKAAALPSPLEIQASEYIQAATKEAKKEPPKKGIITGNLEGAIELLKNVNSTVGSVEELIHRLQEPVKKLAYWLGVAVSLFFG